MNGDMKSQEEMSKELDRIVDFICGYVAPDEKVVIPVSGGMDSDVTARLCRLALGKERIHLFTVLQQKMEEKYLINCRNLADDLNVDLAVIPLGEMNRQLIRILQESDPQGGFDMNSLLDPARANCSLRTAILSSYQDKGYLVASCSNLSEIKLGFYMPFGDNLGHFKPIAHLYKSEVKVLARMLHSREEVLDQQPSAGFWEGEEDLEDLAYWLYNGGPIKGERTFSEEEDEKVKVIRGFLTQDNIDRSLELLEQNRENEEISRETALPVWIVETLARTVSNAKTLKNRELLVRLPR